MKERWFTFSLLKEGATEVNLQRNFGYVEQKCILTLKTGLTKKLFKMASFMS